jgi:hypothetical protein
MISDRPVSPALEANLQSFVRRGLRCDARGSHDRGDVEGPPTVGATTWFRQVLELGEDLPELSRST